MQKPRVAPENRPSVIERNFLASTLAVKRRRGRQHLAHAGAAARPLVADDKHFAVLIVALVDGAERILLAVEAARRTAELQLLHARDLDDGAFRRQRAAQAGDAAGRRQRIAEPAG